MNEPNPTGNAATAVSVTSPIASESGSLPGALLAGVVAAIAGAVLWALITVQSQMQIGFMAIGVGFLVGWAVRRFGRGYEPVYAVLGGAFALLGCLLGNLLSACASLAASQGKSVFDVLGPVLGDAGLVSRLMQATFAPMDLLFYAIAVYEGFKLARHAPAPAKPGG
jgi:hypothetical protein